MKHDNDVVSASEIASWAWCPESWRLDSLGVEPANRAELARGRRSTLETAAFEERSRSAISLGWWLLALAVLVALLALVLVGGSDARAPRRRPRPGPPGAPPGRALEARASACGVSAPVRRSLSMT